MSWLKSLLGIGNKPKGNATPARDEEAPAPVGRKPNSLPEITEESAQRIFRENVAVYCARLEKEADRTGNHRLRTQAAGMRARNGL